MAKRGLQRLGPQKNVQFVLWTDKTAPQFRVPFFRVKTFSSIHQALKTPFEESCLLQINSSRPAGVWVEECARLCLVNTLSAMVTGPLSKGLLAKSYPSLRGQTQLLKQISKTDNVFMTFLGKKFNVILLNDHVSFFKIKLQKLPALLEMGLDFRKFLPPSRQDKPLGLLGLNPHAGEGGLLGNEEGRSPLLHSFSEKQVCGPLSPDGAFLKKNWDQFSFYVALYHDQGLIPFKMIHAHQGVSLSLGLPFIRTGVDHGTGWGLKSQEVSSDSFFAALKQALFLIKKTQTIF